MLQNYPKISEIKDFRSTYFAGCVFNNFICYTAIMLNIIAIHAIRKTSSLPKTLKTLLLSLAVSDVGVGLLVQPFYTSLLVKWLQENNPGCSTYMAFYIVASLFCAASFLGVVAVSLDRFLAIHLHLRYQELVTHKRVVAVVISIWVFSVFSSLLTLLVRFDIVSQIIFFIGIAGFLLTIMIYIRIFLTVRRHKNYIQTFQVQQIVQTEEMANFASLVKSVVGVFYIYLVFLLCYLPYFSLSLVILEISKTSTALKRFYLMSFTLVYLNSSLNPVIFCWKMRHIRHAIMGILRNMSWLRNPASHLP